MSDDTDAIMRAWSLMTDYHHKLYIAAATLELRGHYLRGVFPGDDRSGSVAVDIEPDSVMMPTQRFSLSDYDYSGEGKLWRYDWPSDPQQRWFDTLQDAFDTWVAERDA